MRVIHILRNDAVTNMPSRDDLHRGRSFAHIETKTRTRSLAFAQQHVGDHYECC